MNMFTEANIRANVAWGEAIRASNTTSIEHPGFVQYSPAMNEAMLWAAEAKYWETIAKGLPIPDVPRPVKGDWIRIQANGFVAMDLQLLGDELEIEAAGISSDPVRYCRLNCLYDTSVKTLLEAAKHAYRLVLAARMSPGDSPSDGLWLDDLQGLLGVLV